MYHRRVPVRPFSLRPGARLVPLALAIGGLLAAGPGLAVEYTTYNWTWNSPGYVDWAKQCQRAEGTGSDKCGLPTGQDEWYNDQPPPLGPPADSPILTKGQYEDVDPHFNSYYDWVNNAGYAFRIDSVGINSLGAVGTSGTGAPPTNSLGIGTGQGISGAWELSDNGADLAKIEEARVQIKSGDSTGLTSWGVTNNNLVDLQTGSWLPNLDANQSPKQTPIDKTFVSTLLPDARAINNVDGTVRIQFYQNQDLPDPELPTAVLSDLDIQFNIQTANLKASSKGDVVGRVGGGGTATVEVTNIPTSGLGFRAIGVYAPEATGDDFAVFDRDGPVPPSPPVLLANGTLTTNYLLKIPEFEDYGLSYTANVAVNRGDAPTDPTLPVTLNITSVGPQARVSGYADNETSEGQLYSVGVDGLLTELTAQSNSKFYRDLSFANVFGTDYDTLTDLTLGLNYAGAGVSLFEVVDGEVSDEPITDKTEILIGVGDTARIFRVYLDPTTALKTSSLIAASVDYYGDLLLTTDVKRALNTTTLALNSTIFKFDLHANDSDPVPLPGTLTLLGLGLAGLGLRRSRRSAVALPFGLDHNSAHPGGRCRPAVGRPSGRPEAPRSA